MLIENFYFQRLDIFLSSIIRQEIYSLFLLPKKEAFLKSFFSKIMFLNNTLYSKNWTTRCMRLHCHLITEYKSVYLTVNVIKSESDKSLTQSEIYILLVVIFRFFKFWNLKQSIACVHIPHTIFEDIILFLKILKKKLLFEFLTIS